VPDYTSIVPRMLFGDYVAKIGDRSAVYAAAKALSGGAIALYPGSFLDGAPLGIWPNVIFIDTDRAFARKTQALAEPPAGARFVVADYREPLLDVSDTSVDVLLSLWAGPVSAYCTRYLRIGGHLLANNSHGDASLAMLDERYTLVGALVRDGQSFRTSELEEFSRPVRAAEFTVEHVLASGRGARFVKQARYYLFRRDT
jgi:hypothetical protein